VAADVEVTVANPARAGADFKRDRRVTLMEGILLSKGYMLAQVEANEYLFGDFKTWEETSLLTGCLRSLTR
jgi:hypothetical protein